ncbi:hypothetical protein SAMN05444483_11089, partial [Salegentibacter echinorum]
MVLVQYYVNNILDFHSEPFDHGSKLAKVERLKNRSRILTKKPNSKREDSSPEASFRFVKYNFTYLRKDGNDDENFFFCFFFSLLI